MVAIALLLVACQAPPAAAPPTAAAAPTAAASASGQLVSLKASYSEVIASNLPEWLALEAGIFRQNGLDVELDNIASSTGIAALLSGQTQIAQIGGSETMSAAAQGADPVVIGMLGAVYPFVFMANPSISSIDQLKGKKIGVSNKGSTSDIATRVMLRRVGLDPDHDVTIVAVGSLQNRTAALLNGAIDGGLAQPPEQLALQDKGFHVLYDLAAQKIPSSGDGIVVLRSWLNANHDVAQRYIDSIVEATVRAQQDRQLALQVLQKYLKTDDQRALNNTYDFFMGSVLTTYPSVSADQFADSLTQLSASNDKLKDFNVASIIDDSLVQNAMDRKLAGS
jgi:NitT/TauT family transport system substrate-binding protein